MRKRPATMLLVAACGWSALPASAQERWTEYADVRAPVEYPQHVFSEPGAWKAVAGSLPPVTAALAFTYSAMENPKALSPREFMRSYFPVGRSTLTYDRVARNFFAVSARREGMIVYLRCNFSSTRGGTLHCVDIRYPINEKRDWDGIVTRISRSVRPLPSG